MKFRTKFVSNSSTSSFVIYGIEVPYNEFSFNYDRDKFTHVIKNNKVIVGKLLSSGNGDTNAILDDASFSQDNFKLFAEEIAHEFNSLTKEIKLFMGTVE